MTFYFILFILTSTAINLRRDKSILLSNKITFNRCLTVILPLFIITMIEALYIYFRTLNLYYSPPKPHAFIKCSLQSSTICFFAENIQSLCQAVEITKNTLGVSVGSYINEVNADTVNHINEVNVEIVDEVNMDTGNSVDVVDVDVDVTNSVDVVNKDLTDSNNEIYYNTYSRVVNNKTNDAKQLDLSLLKLHEKNMRIPNIRKPYLNIIKKNTYKTGIVNSHRLAYNVSPIYKYKENLRFFILVAIPTFTLPKVLSSLILTPSHTIFYEMLKWFKWAITTCLIKLSSSITSRPGGESSTINKANKSSDNAKANADSSYVSSNVESSSAAINLGSGDGDEDDWNEDEKKRGIFNKKSHYYYRDESSLKMLKVVRKSSAELMFELTREMLEWVIGAFTDLINMIRQLFNLLPLERTHIDIQNEMARTLEYIRNNTLFQINRAIFFFNQPTQETCQHDPDSMGRIITHNNHIEDDMRNLRQELLRFLHNTSDPRQVMENLVQTTRFGYLADNILMDLNTYYDNLETAWHIDYAHWYSGNSDGPHDPWTGPREGPRPGGDYDTQHTHEPGDAWFWRRHAIYPYDYTIYHETFNAEDYWNDFALYQHANPHHWYPENPNPNPNPNPDPNPDPNPNPSPNSYEPPDP